MRVRYQVTGKRLARAPLRDRSLWQEIGELAVERVVGQTQSGRDPAGAGFAAYSPGYVKQKAKYRGTTTGTVDLTLTGKMLNDLQPVTVTDHSAEVGFVTARSNEIAGYHLGEGRVDRVFLGLSPRALRDIDARVAAFLRAKVG